MKYLIFIVLIAFACSAVNDPEMKLNPLSDCKPFAYYSNERSIGGEFSTGYNIALWSSQNKLLGFACYNDGVIGDDKCGLITGSKLKDETIQVEFEVGGELFILKGKIDKNQIIGEVSSHIKPKKEIVLKVCCQDAEIFKPYPNIKSWSTRVQKIF